MKSAVITTPVDTQERIALGINPGDTVRVWQKIEELKQSKGADKKKVTVKTYRKQAFEGIVLAVKHGGVSGEMFTVRKVASGVGVEKIFPLFSPMIDSIEVLRRTRTRRAKLYFIRRKAAHEVRRAMRKSVQVVQGRKVSAEVHEEPVEVAEAVEVSAE